VPGYFVAQLLAGFVAAAVIYFLYLPELMSRDPTFSVYGENSTLRVFVMTQTKGRSNLMEFLGETFATMMMVLIIFATGVDDNEARPVRGLGALAIGLAVVGVGVATGNYALNPARDIGPRLFAMIVYGPQVFTVDNVHFVIPLIAPFIGATLGGGLHEISCVY
jgi:glycerol uptake facilitator protein